MSCFIPMGPVFCLHGYTSFFCSDEGRLHVQDSDIVAARYLFERFLVLPAVSACGPDDKSDNWDLTGSLPNHSHELIRDFNRIDEITIRGSAFLRLVFHGVFRMSRSYH